MATNAAGTGLLEEQSTLAAGLVEKLTERLAVIELRKRTVLDHIHDVFRSNSTELTAESTCLGTVSIASGTSIGEDRLQSLLSQKAAQLGKLKARNAGHQDNVLHCRMEILQVHTELAEEKLNLERLNASVNERLHLLWPWQQEQMELSRRSEISAKLREQLEHQAAEISQQDQDIESMQRRVAAQSEELTRVVEEEQAIDGRMLAGETSMLESELRQHKEEIAQQMEAESNFCEKSETLMQDLSQRLLSMSEGNSDSGRFSDSEARELQQINDRCERLASRVAEVSSLRDEEIRTGVLTVEELRGKLEEQRSTLQTTSSSIYDLKCQLVDGDQDCSRLRSELASNAEQLKRLKHERAVWKKHQHQIGSIEERVSALADACQLHQCSSDADWTAKQSVEAAVSSMFEELGFGQDAAELSAPHDAVSSLLIASSVEAAVAKLQDELQILVPCVLHALARAQAATAWRDVERSPHVFEADLRKRYDEVPSVREALLQIWKALPKSNSDG